MNVYEAISDYLTNSMYNVNGYDSRVELAKLVAAYDALAPDWSSAPDDAKWYVIDNGVGKWCDGEPTPYATGWGYRNCGRTWFVGGERGITTTIHIPLGIDPRMCKWQRPEVK